MDIYELAEQKLSEMNEVATIEEISLVGSSVFEENGRKPGDVDYLILCNNFSRKSRVIKITIDGIKYDLRFYDIGEYKNEISFYAFNVGNNRHSVYNTVWAAIRVPVYGSTNLQWNIFDYKEKYINFIKEYIYGWAYDPDHYSPVVKGKMFVAAYLALKFFENNSLEITEDIKRDVSILYSGSMLNSACHDIIVWVGEKLGLICQV